MNDNGHIAMYQGKAGSGSVQCLLCPHYCVLSENSAGKCGTRTNRQNSLISSGYGSISSIALDPIEKKPLYMFHPGSQILSIGGYGCNLTCPFCQNHEISMSRDVDMVQRSTRVTPDAILSYAEQTIPAGNIGVAYTYNEPFINFEFLLDCAELVRGAGLKNIVVTNGFINTEPLAEALPLIDAMNIDLKGFTEDFYRGLSGKLAPVMDAITLAHKRCHIEITTLVVPGENEDDVAELAKWLSSLSPDIPLHLTRFFPRYMYTGKMATSRETIYRLQETAKRSLNYVFAGNM